MKRSLVVIVLIVPLVLATIACEGSDPLAECIGYCEAYWGDTDDDPLTPMVDEGEYYICVDTCEEIQ